MSNLSEPLSEIQWRSPAVVAELGSLHSNNILFYFSRSPFFERTSNNNIIFAQALSNPTMLHYIQTREAFEARLRSMSGLEFMVGEEPAENGPNVGTGVWVIRKQTRRKQYQEEDEVTVHASYFIVGENIYMAPKLSDLLASKVMTISTAIAKTLPAAQGIRKWRPSLGHVYNLPEAQPQARPVKARESKESTPMPEAVGRAAQAPAGARGSQKQDELSLERAVDESFYVHMRYGGEYVDENPITGRPGEFHLTSTGRRPVAPPQQRQQAGINTMNGPTINTKLDDKKDGKPDKTPKSATMPKPKRRKSKIGKATTPSAS